jgi:hypothetical protein
MTSAVIHTTIGVVSDKVRNAIEYHRNKMTYSCVSTTTGGVFTKSIIRKPTESNVDYWEVMRGFYPWLEIKSIFSAQCEFGNDTPITISIELAGALNCQ